MNIPDKAIEAAARAMVSNNPDHNTWSDLTDGEAEWYARDARSALEAAAPFIAAQVLRDLAEDEGAFYLSTWLRDRASEMENK